MESFYVRARDSTFEATAASAGPWSPDLQHAGPPAALLVKAIEEGHVDTSQRLGRVSVDVLAPIPVAPISVSTREVRPGKKTALIEAVATVDNRPVLIVRTWRFPRVDPQVPANSVPPTMPAANPEGYDGGSIPGANLNGYLSATQWRFTEGRFDELGPGKAWGHTPTALVDDETLTSWQRVMVLADSSSGISLQTNPRSHPAINADLSVVLHRDLEGEWLHIDSSTHIAPDQGAAASGELSDPYGVIGMCTQTLFASTA